MNVVHHLPWGSLQLLGDAIRGKVHADAIATREAEARWLVINGHCRGYRVAQLCLIGGLRTHTHLQRRNDQGTMEVHLALGECFQGGSQHMLHASRP